MEDEYTLTGKQTAAVITLFIQVLQDPPLLREVLTDPEEPLVDLGMTDDDIQEISEYMQQMKTILEESMGITFDAW